jgi:hypothetical protein
MSPFVTPLLLALMATGAAPPPSPMLPLRKDGTTDYQAGLNDLLGRGVAPEKNANVLLWQAFGPRPEGGSGMPSEYFRRLGMKEPPTKGDYIVGLNDFVTKHAKLTDAQRESLFEDHRKATHRPWSAKDHPRLAEWIALNERPLRVAVEATRRPEYFNPLVSRDADHAPGGLMGALLPGVQKAREIASLLVSRAMLRLDEGKYDDAWRDLIACHRLGRLVARGGTLIEALVGIAIDAIATGGDLAYLEHARPTSAQLRRRLTELQGLPAMPAMADKIDLTERFNFMDSLQMVRRGGVKSLAFLEDGRTSAGPTWFDRAAMWMVDWRPAFRTGDLWYDRMADAARLRDRANRVEAFGKIDREMRHMRSDFVPETSNLRNRLMSGEGKLGEKLGKAVGDLLISLLLPAVGKVQGAYDRAEQTQRNLHVAFALEAYRRDEGRYPAQLGALAPKYLRAVPGDLFADRPLTYRPAKGGYLLYSVGLNGKDDGGRWTDDTPPGDDLRVRMPAGQSKK